MWDTTPTKGITEAKTNTNGSWFIHDVKKHEVTGDVWRQFDGAEGRMHIFVTQIKTGPSPADWDYMRVLVRKNVVWTAWIHFDHLHQDGDDYWTKLGGHPFGQKDHDRLLDANGDEIYTDLGVNRLVDMKHLVGTAHGAIFTPKPRQIMFNQRY